MARWRGAETAAALFFVVTVWCWCEPALAEIQKCRGVWTNRPCDEEEQRRLPETRRPPRSKEEIDLDRKKLLIQDLEIRILTARSQYNIEVGIESERILCLDQESSVGQCDEAVNKKRKEIEDRSLSAAKRQAAERVAHGASDEAKDQHQIITIIQQPPELEDHRHREHEQELQRPKDADAPAAQASSSSLTHSKASAGYQGTVDGLR